MATGVDKIAIIGAGSMGSMMALLFAEKGCTVTIQDPSEEGIKLALHNADVAGYRSQIKAVKDYESLIKNLGSPRVILFSLPHGGAADNVIKGLHPYLERGDIIVDASNEHWERTQRRQGELMAQGVYYIGMGVSGGYQSARAGPSMSPGGDDRALEKVMPLFEKAAAKSKDGKPCVAKIGTGGSGHYTKMVHNGIEQGMMSALCEAWGIMHHGLGMPYKEIADVLEDWCSKGELENNFLVSIGVKICRTTNPEDHKMQLDKIKDKVVQDVDETEGTGVWTVDEGIRKHVPMPTIAASHIFRVESAYASQRRDTENALHGPVAEVSRIEVNDKLRFLDQLRQATYCTFLASFVQGLDLLREAERQNKWGINFAKVIAIWKNGCIIRSDYISALLEPIFQKSNLTELLDSKDVIHQFKTTYPALKHTTLRALEADLVVPSLSATVEYLKYSTRSHDLPTQFMEAELDFFGKHMFDLKDDPAGQPVTGSHHFEWQPAKGLESEKAKMTK